MRITVLCTDLGIRLPGEKGASMHLASITSAFAAEGEPGRRATATSGTPLSLRFRAWAKPWLP